MGCDLATRPRRQRWPERLPRPGASKMQIQHLEALNPAAEGPEQLLEGVEQHKAGQANIADADQAEAQIRVVSKLGLAMIGETWRQRFGTDCDKQLALLRR